MKLSIYWNFLEKKRSKID